MSKTRLHELSDLGQSIWLDYISRTLLENGSLQEMISSGLRGMTSNPSIFHQAISSSNDYDEKIIELKNQGKTAFEIYDELTVSDIQAAADIFKPVYDQTEHLDGYVSLEINPQLANQATESIKEGKRLFANVNRPNVMIKVPATEAGFPVIEELLASGINVNVTLIFSLEQYHKTTDAFIRGLERFYEKGGDISKIRSVASVFISRIDTAVDQMLEDKIPNETNETIKNRLSSLRGTAAVVNSKIIFAAFKEIFSQERFKNLASKGAEVQRVLWGSTGTKNSNYSDIKYVTELIGRPTVNTLPEKTINAFLDHGIVRESLSADAEDARNIVHMLKGFGIDVDAICLDLLNAGVLAFEKAFTGLLDSIEAKSRDLALKPS